MANPINLFNSNARFAGAYSAENAVMTFPSVVDDAGIPMSGLMVQSANYSFDRPVTRFFEIGSPMFWYVAQRASGTISMSRLVGPSNFALKFYEQFADHCQAGKNNFELNYLPGCNSDDLAARNQNGQGVSRMFKSAIITTLAGSTSSEFAILSENFNMIYTGLILDTGTKVNLSAFTSA